MQLILALMTTHITFIWYSNHTFNTAYMYLPSIYDIQLNALCIHKLFFM